jgi:hypothetical protein
VKAGSEPSSSLGLDVGKGLGARHPQPRGPTTGHSHSADLDSCCRLLTRREGSLMRSSKLSGSNSAPLVIPDQNIIGVD